MKKKSAAKKAPATKAAPRPSPAAVKPKSKSLTKARQIYQVEPVIRPEFYVTVAETLRTARSKAYRAIDSYMVEAYWTLGRRIAEEELHGKERADYGTALLSSLAVFLTVEFGPGFDERELRRMRQFYRCFPIRGTLCPEFTTHSKSISSVSFEGAGNGVPVGDLPIRGALRPELSWSHYRLLIRVEDSIARTWYMNEAADQNWSSRALSRQINSLYYQRLLSSRDRQPVVEEMLEKTTALLPSPRDFIRDPVVLEFLDIPPGVGLRESRLEQAILGKLQQFLLELGKGFAFVARQQRVSTETKDFYVDLVFYNYLLKCFVLVDLKIGELTHQDIGQMDMYVRLYEDLHKGTGDNPTVGLILCTEKDHTVVKYSVLNESRQIFASKYQLYLPSEEELRREIEIEHDNVLREIGFEYGRRKEDATAFP